MNLLVALFIAAVPAPHTTPAFKADPAHVCGSCEAWNAPHEPFRIFGNTYYVGVQGLGAILIHSDAGLILLDGGLPQTAPRIDASIRKLGFRTQDIRLIVNSHAHYDHAGGIAALQRASGATVAASAWGAKAIENGGPLEDDPQAGFGKETNAFPAVKKVKVVADGETLTVGNAAITAHATPGHTPGSTSWTWRSCEGERCLNLVYADSLTPVSAEGFRFTGDATHPSREASFRKALATVAELPCDILFRTHPDFEAIDARLAERKKAPGGPDPLVDPGACRALAERSTRALDERVAEEAKEKRP